MNSNHIQDSEDGAPAAASAIRRSGRLKLFLGYAAGVGKTYKMLEEAQQLVKEGHDLAVGYFEPHGRSDTIARTEGLELIPRRHMEYRGRVFEEMDTDAILKRRPAICLVDELAHSNVPGAERTKRWEDIMVILEAGIDVMTTMNVQHIESLNDCMREITGIRVRETVPDWVVGRADEIVLVDLPPEALLNRLQRGVVYPPEKARQAMEHFFRDHILWALREVAMRQTLHEIEVHQAEPVVVPSEPHGEQGAVAPERAQERVLIYVSDSPSTAALVRRGRRVADYLRAECFAVCVLPSADLSRLKSKAREPIERHLDFARKLRIETRILEGRDAASTLLDFARRNGVTQIFLGRPLKRRFWFRALRDFVMKVVRRAKDMQVIVVAD